MAISPLRIISYNVNGLRAAMNKGLIDWLKTDVADIFCVQEIKAHRDNVAHALFTELGYHDYWFPAQKKGYSGVLTLSKKAPLSITRGIAIIPDHYQARVVSDEEKRADLAARLNDTLNGLKDVRQGQEELSKRLGDFINELPKTP